MLAVPAANAFLIRQFAYFWQAPSFLFLSFFAEGECRVIYWVVLPFCLQNLLKVGTKPLAKVAKMNYNIV